MNKARSKGNKFKPDDTFEYIRLISEFHAQTNIEFVTKKYFLQPLDFKDGIIPDNLLLETVMINNVEHVISWMDICHQIYALASLMIIITHCFQLSYKSAQVQSLICKLMEPMVFGVISGRFVIKKGLCNDASMANVYSWNQLYLRRT